MVEKRRRGYTLFEMVLVTALVGVLTALVVPYFDSMHADKRLTAASDQVRACWAEARSRAVEEGRPYRFKVVPDTGNSSSPRRTSPAATARP